VIIEMSLKLVHYENSDSDPDHDEIAGQTSMEFTALPTQNLCPSVDPSAVVEFQRKSEVGRDVDFRSNKDLTYNAKYEKLFAPEFGPARTTNSDAQKNFLTGHIQAAHVSESQFEEERRAFHFRGKAADPSEGSGSLVVQKGAASAAIGATTVETTQQTDLVLNSKRKRLANNDAADVDNFVGPWAPYADELTVAQPTEEEKAEIDEFIAKKKKVVYSREKKENDEQSTLHIKDPYDYQGRSFLHAPQDLDVNLKADHVPDKCFIPKRCIHTYTGHSKAVSAIRLFPQSGHLFLSAGMDSKIKLWEMYNERRCVLTYQGHRQAIRDICFNRFGDRFLSCGYDKALKLWDTETGQCIKRFDNRKIAYCVKFNNSDDASHLFLTGMSDKKVLCWDSRSGNVVQEYDRHLGAVNTINFVDHYRRFVTTSDDKSLRVWEWDIPVDIKYIADPSMHAIPAASSAPNGKWLACQFMDNKIQAFSCLNRFKLHTKKTFSGHMVAGYACAPAFSPDMSYLVSGDADGKVFFWDWKTTKLLTSFKAHDNVCINVVWHPHETSKLLTCGWDKLIKLWD
jgi:pre-mRNA-processing factor 17